MVTQKNSINSTLDSKETIEQSGIKFGTSGARGLVTQFTPNVCGAFSIAFIKCMQQHYKFTTIAIAIDNRPSSYAMAQACSSACEQLNIKVVYYGVLPTPALAYKAMNDSNPAIMVTGSHIPFDRNGLKFYRPDGEISKSDEKFITKQSIEFNSVRPSSSLKIDSTAATKYIERYTAVLSSTSLKNKHIGIYEHSSAGRDLYYKLFEALGARVTRLERSDEFVPIDTEAVSHEDTIKALEWARHHHFDMIFSTDGDGDRPLVSDENGAWVRGDVLGLLCAMTLKIDALAVPVSCNTAIEKCGLFKHVYRTKIGSPYVIEQFSHLSKHYKVVAGFEANGGFLLGADVVLNNTTLKSLPTRDAVLPALMLLLAAENESISKVIERLPARFTFSERLQNFSKEKSEKIIKLGNEDPSMLLKLLGFKNIEVECLDDTDGVRITLVNGEVIHLRPSGNAPELRCYAEADTLSKANQLVTNILTEIKSLELN